MRISECVLKCNLLILNVNIGISSFIQSTITKKKHEYLNVHNLDRNLISIYTFWKYQSITCIAVSCI